jgi:hypothetical protein
MQSQAKSAMLLRFKPNKLEWKNKLLTSSLLTLTLEVKAVRSQLPIHATAVSADTALITPSKREWAWEPTSY